MFLSLTLLPAVIEYIIKEFKPDLSASVVVTVNPVGPNWFYDNKITN